MKRKHLIKPMLICLAISIVSLFLLVNEILAYDLYLAARPQAVAGEVVYVLDTTDSQHMTLKKSNPKLFVIEENFQGTGLDLLVYKTNSVKDVITAHKVSEFIGTSYIDMLARLALGQSNFTWNQLKRLIRCKWQRKDGTYTSGIYHWQVI